MNLKCFFRNCETKPSSYCKCTDIPSVSCDNHLIEHCKTNGNHRILEILRRPHPDTRSKIIEKVNQIKTDLKTNKKSFMSESFKIISLINNLNQLALIHFENLIRECNEILKTATQDEIHGLENQNIIENILILSPDKAETILTMWNADKSVINYGEIEALIKKNLDNSKIDPFKSFKETNNGPHKIMFFIHNTKQLVTCDLTSLTTSAKEHTTLPAKINWALSICMLSNQSIFCYGNSGSGLTFIIDKDMNITQLPDGKINYRLNLHHHENHVYAIGGLNKLAEKFNLIENKWESCAAIPKDYNYDCCRSALIGKNILVVGCFLKKAVNYDIKLNSFAVLKSLSLTAEVHKFIFTAKSRVYIGECQTKIFESAENDLTRWTCIASTNSVWNHQMSQYILIKDSVFFLMYPNKLYKFKLKTKEIKHVKDI